MWSPDSLVGPSKHGGKIGDQRKCRVHIRTTLIRTWPISIQERSLGEMNAKTKPLDRIVFNGVTMHTATAVTTIGANGKAADLFYLPYSIMERMQVIVFFIQELILSSLYLWKSKSFLDVYQKRRARGGKLQRKVRSMVLHLVLSNVIVVVREYITIPCLPIHCLDPARFRLPRSFPACEFKGIRPSPKIKEERGFTPKCPQSCCVQYHVDPIF